jgi:hypothetical protein
MEVTYWVLHAAVDIGKEALGRTYALVQIGGLQAEEDACTNNYSVELKKTIDSLSEALDEYPDYDIVITKVRKSLAEAEKKHLEWNCEQCRKGESKQKVDELSKGNDLGKIIAILSTLVNPVKK